MSLTMPGTPNSTAGTGPGPTSNGLVRWLSLRAYGLVTSVLFGATTPPRKMRARFERFARAAAAPGWPDEPRARPA